MNINEQLLLLTRNSDSTTEDYLTEYQCSRTEIEDFLLTVRKFEHRQKKAIDIVEDILTYHGKEELLRSVAGLAKIEYRIRKLQPWRRDHVVHALLTFILGIYLNESWLPRPAVRFQWKLAGLLHDVAYPAEVAHQVLDSMPDALNEIATHLGFPEAKIQGVTQLKGLEDLRNGVKALDLIQTRLLDWGLAVDAHAEYERMISERPCHGIYTSLAVLWVIDMMYQTNNPERQDEDNWALNDISWAQSYFDADIVSACAAIFLHNLPSRCFEQAKVDRNRAPVAFLLKLCDAMQEWERPRGNSPRGSSAKKFYIQNDGTALVLSAGISEKTKDKIRAEIETTLDAPDVRII